MSEELKRELGGELEVLHEVLNEVVNEVVEPLKGLKLYNSFKKSLPKGLSKDTVALRWVEYKIMLGMPIVEKKEPKEKKEKKEKVVKFKVPKEKKEKKEKVVKKKVLDENNNMCGDYNLDIVIPDIPIMQKVVEVC